ncbi:MAG: DUF2254 domain-containing protein [Phycisphaerales bacterium]
MKSKLLDLFDQLRSSLWFLPGMLSIGGFLLAVIAIEVDRRLGNDVLRTIPWLSTGDAAGARTILSTIAGSMITIAGVAFSIIIVALSLAASQFGPRLLRNFMRDRINQLMLGVFVAVFTYCAVVLRVVQSSSIQSALVPYLAVTLGVLLSLFALGMFVYFIHHVAMTLQADVVIASVAEEFESVARRYWQESAESESSGDENSSNTSLESNAQDGTSISKVTAGRSGYIRRADIETLTEIASEHELMIELCFQPGDFVLKDLPLARIAHQAIDEDCIDAVRGAITIGSTRSSEQDLRFCVHQIVEIAMRALSPGVNDPFTAMACIDRLAGALGLIANRLPPPNLARDEEDGSVRVTWHPRSFDNITAACWNQIRQAARGNTAVTIRMLEAIGLVLRVMDGSWPERQADLNQHIDLILADAEASIANKHDLNTVRETARKARVIDTTAS